MKNKLYKFCFAIILIHIIFYSCTDDNSINELINSGTLKIELGDNPHFCMTETHSVAQDIGQNSTNGLGIIRNYKWENGQKIRVKFIGGNSYLHDKVIQYSRIWEQYANIDFHFVDSGDSEVRIGFDRTLGHWSALGTQVLKVGQDKPTMNLALNDSNKETEFSRIILHEFGHTLGLIHEHQHPLNPIQWNRENVYQFTRDSLGWSKDKTNRNIFREYNSIETNFSKYDSSSIMHYPVSKYFTLDNFSIGENNDLSNMDKCYISELYPFESKPFKDFSQGASWLIGDFNGDGRDDLVKIIQQVNTQTRLIEVALSKQSYFDDYQIWGIAMESSNDAVGWLRFSTGDFNGDGKTDLVRTLFDSKELHVALSNGDSFEDFVKWGHENLHFVGVGDFNGDDKDDLLYFKDNKGGAKVSLSNGNNFEDAVLWTSEPVPTLNGFWILEDSPGLFSWKIGDYNGDGKDDLLKPSPSIYGGIKVLYSQNEKFSVGANNSSNVSNTNIISSSIGDFNGDGLDDLLSHVSAYFGARVYLSEGNSFGKFKIWNNHEAKSSWMVGDFDGDGKDDIMKRDSKSLKGIVYLSDWQCF